MAFSRPGSASALTCADATSSVSVIASVELNADAGSSAVAACAVAYSGGGCFSSGFTGAVDAASATFSCRGGWLAGATDGGIAMEPAATILIPAIRYGRTRNRMIAPVHSVPTGMNLRQGQRFGRYSEDGSCDRRAATANVTPMPGASVSNSETRG